MLDWQPVTTKELQVRAAQRMLREWMRLLRAARSACIVG